MQEKNELVQRIFERHAYLAEISQSDFSDLWRASWLQVRNNLVTGKHRPGCNNNCCDSYVDAMDDCDTDFAIGTAVSILAAAGATIGGTPLAGAGALSAGMGATYAASMRCSRSAARDYRSCMGY